MDPGVFTDRSPGRLIRITGTDPRYGEWQHSAFQPDPLSSTSPDLSGATYRIVADARAELAALDSTSRRLPDPGLFRRPALQAEAQSTSALEGTYAPLADVLSADEDRPPNLDVREILNYVATADTAFRWIKDDRPLTSGLLCELQALLMRGTRNDNAASGRLRTTQVVIGRRTDARPGDPPIRSARFVPAPPGADLEAGLRDLLVWMSSPDALRDIDPVVAAALAHYQFESLHPFHDGNGRLGRLLIVVHLVLHGVLLEPTLTVSPWFETRRGDYYDRLLAVSTRGDWDAYVAFFATGLAASARRTHERMLALVDVQRILKERVRASTLRADTAQALVDFAVANSSFTVRAVERALGISYGRANGVVDQLVHLGVLAPLTTRGGTRRFHAPAVHELLLSE